MRDLYLSGDISVVVDNNILIDLFELGCLHLLFLCFKIVIIPKVLYEHEVSENIKIELSVFEFHLADIETERGLEIYRFLLSDVNYRKLSRMDRFAISIAGEKHYYCNSNDLPVRRACDDLGIKYTGILGVLGRAFHMLFISREELDEYIGKIESNLTSCYIKHEVIKDFYEHLLDNGE